MRRTVNLALNAAIVVSVVGLALSPSAFARDFKDVAPVGVGGVGGAVADPLPIKRIVLYRSGVGYFERTGKVDGAATIQLQFKTEQVNDILKSLIALDLDGGRVESVGYASQEPLSRRLASFGVDLSSNPSAGELLGRLRGTSVRISTPEGEVSGTILNVESKPTVYAGGGAQTQPALFTLPWINLVTDHGVRSLNLASATGFEILDAGLAAEITKALAAMAQHRDDRTKAVDVRFAGQGERRIAVGYVHETPVWKTSYRLVIPENADDKLTMQGWAIVENTTDQDWKDVDLALVSGRPVGFQMDLYQPLYMPRPMFPVPSIAGAIARIYDGGTAIADAKDQNRLSDLASVDQLGSEKAEMRMRGDLRKMSAASPTVSFSGFGDMPSPVTAEAQASAALNSSARAGEVGEVFQYRLDSPVSIERQRSAMLPILGAKIPGRRVSIYSGADGSPNPMRGVELTNDAGLQLLPGPITVLDGAAYAGDAQIGHISPGDKRLLSYAVDLDVVTLIKHDSDGDLATVRIVNGTLVRTIKARDTTAYTFTNKDAKRPRTIVVEHPRLGGYDLTVPAKPSDETQGAYRFEVQAAAGGKGELKVVQERTYSETGVLTAFDLGTFQGWHKSGKLSNAVLKAIQESGARQAALNEAERQGADLKRQMDEIDAEQGRVRANMQAIDRASQLYGTYMAKLTDQEKQLESLKAKRAETLQRIEQLRREYEAFVKDLNVE